MENNLIVPEGYEYIDFSDKTFRTAYLECLHPSKKITLVMGRGGSGKSEIYKMIASYYKNKALCCATTGVAAYNLQTDNVSPVTVSSAFGLGITPYFRADFNSSGADASLKGKKIVLIDEVSMLNANQLDIVLKLIHDEEVKSNREIKVLLFGDPLQLPPIWKDKDMSLFKYEIGDDYSQDKWQFYNSHLYQFFDKKIFALTHNFRQSDSEFSKALSKIRIGDNEQKLLDYFNQSVGERKGIDITDTDRLIEDGYLFLKYENAEVQKINNENLKKLQDLYGTDKQKHKRYNAIYSEKSTKKLEKVEGFTESLDIYIGEKVMCTRNFYDNNHNCIFQNGTIGTVIGFKRVENADCCGTFPVIRKDNGQEIQIYPIWFTDDSYEMDKNGFAIKKTESEACQIPLKPAYAITYHKAQGLTLEKIFLTIPRNRGEGTALKANKSMVYMGLSRVKTIKGLLMDRALVPSDITVGKDDVAIWKENCKEDA